MNNTIRIPLNNTTIPVKMRQVSFSINKAKADASANLRIMDGLRWLFFNKISAMIFQNRKYMVADLRLKERALANVSEPIETEF